MNPMALPREAREVSEFNGLPKGLGQKPPIESQYISTSHQTKCRRTMFFSPHLDALGRRGQ